MKSVVLLLPFGDSQTRTLLNQEGHPFFLAETPAFPRTMDLEDFSFGGEESSYCTMLSMPLPQERIKCGNIHGTLCSGWAFWLAGFIVGHQRNADQRYTAKSWYQKSSGTKNGQITKSVYHFAR